MRVKKVEIAEWGGLPADARQAAGELEALELVERVRGGLALTALGKGEAGALALDPENLRGLTFGGANLLFCVGWRVEFEGGGEHYAWAGAGRRLCEIWEANESE